MQTYRNQTVQGKSLVVDEIVFPKCKLIDCDLYYSGGDAEFVETGFENCRFHWRGPAKNTVAFLQMMGMIRMPMPPQNSGIPGQKPN